MSGFAFVGKLPASKSILNRLLLAQSYAPYLKVEGESHADDVRFMREAVIALHEKKDIYAGSAGTVLRFMALRASREPGRHRLVGEPRLFQRPQDELLKILKQVGVEAKLTATSLELEGDGWRLHGDTLLVPFQRSSQFATGVLLNAWNLPFDLYVSLGGQKVSEGYWRMSTRLAQELGMRLDFWDGDFRVPRGQKVTREAIAAEIDVSSAFALAAVAAVSGAASFLDFPEGGLQPDTGFVAVLERMGVPLAMNGGHTLKVERARQLNGVAVNLKTMPDLFPVLAILAALAEGDSELYGAPHLVHKESDRLGQMAEWLRRLGREVEVKADGLRLSGPAIRPSPTEFIFDCEGDHRLAFAAAVLRAAGFQIRIGHPEAVTKSFPEFWSILGWDPKSLS